MLALIDRLSSKLTTLAEIVKTLTDAGPSVSVPYSGVGDVYVGNQQPPNPEPGYAYRCESITNGLKFSGYPLSTAEFNKIKPWRARKSWTDAPVKYGWSPASGSNIDQLEIYTIGRAGSIIVNKTTKKIYSSLDGHVNWKEVPFPDQDKCQGIINFDGVCYDDAGYMFAAFDINGVAATRIMYLELDSNTKEFTWRTVLTLQDANPAPSGTMGGIVDFSVATSANAWAILYQPDSVNKDLHLMMGYKYDTPDKFKNFNLGSTEAYTNISIGYSGSFILLMGPTKYDIYAHSSDSIEITYLLTELTGTLTPKTPSYNNKPEYAYDNGSGWFYINSAEDTICYLGGHVKKVEPWLTFTDWVNSADLDTEKNGIEIKPLKFVSYMASHSTNAKIAGIEVEANDVYGGNNYNGTLYFCGFGYGADGKPIWTPISPATYQACKPAMNNSNGVAYFIANSYGYEYKVNIFFSECLTYTKDISVPPIPGGWCITGKYKLQEEV